MTFPSMEWAQAVYQVGDRFRLSGESLATFAANRERVVRERGWGVHHSNSTVGRKRKNRKRWTRAGNTCIRLGRSCTNRVFLEKASIVPPISFVILTDIFPVPQQATLHALLPPVHLLAPSRSSVFPSHLAGCNLFRNKSLFRSVPFPDVVFCGVRCMKGEINTAELLTYYSIPRW
jgi:hypothetical protein